MSQHQAPAQQNPNDPTGIHAKSQLMQHMVQRKMPPHTDTPDAEGVMGGQMKQSMHLPMSGETAGFIAASLMEMQGPMQKTASIVGKGRGLSAAIDLLVKGAGHSLEEMMNILADSGRLDNPDAARKIGKGGK